VLASYWRAYRPPAVDVALAAAFIVLGQVLTWGELEGPESSAGPRATNAVLSALFLASLAWRRRAPLAAMCWAVAVYFLPHAVVQHDITFWGGGVPLMLLTASAGYYCSRDRAVLALGLGLAAFVVATLYTPLLRSPDAFIWNVVFLSVPWIGARALREREERAATLAATLATERSAKDAALRDAAAAERAHIARELHDIVAHSVSMMVIQVGAARMQLQAGPAGATAPLLDAEDVGRQTLQDLRRLLGVLRADEEAAASTDGGAAAVPEPPQPGLSRLDVLVRPIRAAGLRVDVDVVGDPVVLPAALDLTSYRVVQEALTNTLKHSGGTSVTVRLRYTSSALLIDVLDDGTAARAGEDAGHGLVGIDERVSMFGGTVSAGPHPDGGWRVHTELPLPDPSSQDSRVAALPVP
jgi:signal transduction histidine kinase